MISNTATGMGVDPSGDPIEVDSSSGSDPDPDGEVYQNDSIHLSQARLSSLKCHLQVKQ